MSQKLNKTLFVSVSTIALLGFGLLFLFQNCAPLAPQNELQGSLPAAFQMRVASLQTLPIDEKKQLCDSLDRYVCTRKVFKPKVAYIDTNVKACIDVNGKQDCNIANYHQYDTQAAIDACSDCKAEDKLPGGRYNYEESLCYHKDFKIDFDFVGQGEASSVEEALKIAIQKCHQLLGE